MTNPQNLASGECPLPLDRYPRIVTAHGGGGLLTRQLITDMFYHAFDNSYLKQETDSTVLPLTGHRLAFSTDSYVIQPLEFPGGDIGELAVYGTVNDLCMSGAVPKYISLAFILQEGLEIDRLWRFVNSIRKAVLRCGVQIVTGDTKVVDSNKNEGLYINTTGIGIFEREVNISPASIEPGDVILLSGDIGRHGIAVMATREGLAFETELVSDCAPLHEPVHALLSAGLTVHALRDLTRGGLAAALYELSHSSGFGFDIRETAVPVCDAVHGACELLGFDPFYVANEGRFIAFVPAKETAEALGVLRGSPQCADAVQIGTVGVNRDRQVILNNDYGGQRILQLFSGEQLPRIC